MTPIDFEALAGRRFHPQKGAVRLPLRASGVHILAQDGVAAALDSVSSPITRRVYNLGLDEFFAWYGQEPRAGFTKATVSAWRVALEGRSLGSVSINVRITAVRKLAVEAADNGLLAPELAAGIA